MAKVTVDGTDYIPATNTTRIGIAITTHNRATELAECLKSIQEFTPSGTPIFVVDDGSTKPAKTPEGVEVFRFNTSRGIVAAKNKCLELLIDAGCDNLFLLDDDMQVLTTGWYQPYIDSPEHHLAYQFEDLTTGVRLRDITKVYEDTEHVAFSGQRGVMLYYTRQAIETVGGFDPIYGRGYYEHIDLAYRIHEAGLTTFKYMDVQGSSNLIYSMDEHGQVVRSTPQSKHDEQVRANANIFNTRRDNRERIGYVPFRSGRDVVLTSLLTASTDPQRGTKWASDYKDLQTLHESIKSGSLVLFHDAKVKGLPEDVQSAPVAPSNEGNPYFLRWVHAYKHLRDNPDTRYVVCCDANDVEFQADPFKFLPTIPDDQIVVGDEYELVSNEWIAKNHRWCKLDEFLKQYGDKQLLNMGFIAGTRETVMEFLHHLITEWEDYQFDVFNKRRNADEMVGDMGIGNMVLYTHFSDRIFHGPKVNTRFKGNERNTFSLIRHK